MEILSLFAASARFASFGKYKLCIILMLCKKTFMLLCWSNLRTRTGPDFRRVFDLLHIRESKSLSHITNIDAVDRECVQVAV